MTDKSQNFTEAKKVTINELEFWSIRLNFSPD